MFSLLYDANNARGTDLLDAVLVHYYYPVLSILLCAPIRFCHNRN